MQQNPVQRTVRVIILSVGFVLFVLLAVRSASQISDPRFIRGNPFLFATTHSPQLIGDTSTNVQNVTISQPVSLPAQHTTHEHELPGKSAAKLNAANITASARSQIVPGQIKKTSKD